MRLKALHFFLLALSAVVTINFSSCSKSSPDNNQTDPCAGKNIILSSTVTASAGCTSNAGIVASATGSTNFTYKLNSGGTFQASGTFINIAPGNYTLFAKDGAGCEKTSLITVTSGSRGPLFTMVKNLMTAKCQSCHNNTVQNGGQNWEVDCNIVSSQVRIKVRAVDEGTMPINAPPLSASEKSIIINWINAGGRITD